MEPKEEQLFFKIYGIYDKTLIPISYFKIYNDDGFHVAQE